MSTRFLSGKHIGQTIRRLRVEKRITLPHFCTYSGVSKGTLSKIENGFGNPTLRVLNAIARGLKLKTSNLINLHENAK